MANLHHMRAVDSEIEEGEIVDELDQLSDISSEEEYLVRQRLRVLESYNNVLERKKSKDSSFDLSKKRNWPHTNVLDLSEISATELEEVCSPYRRKNERKIIKKDQAKNTQKKSKSVQNISRNKNKKKYHKTKKKEQKIISESSEESDDEYRNKRRKLANAVKLHEVKNDSSLKARIIKMLCPSPQEHIETRESLILHNEEDSVVQKVCNKVIINDLVKQEEVEKETECVIVSNDCIDLCSDGETTRVDCNAVSVNNIAENDKPVSSDEDLELLREYALKTKPVKAKENTHAQPTPDGEDSDVAELRLICLKSALLKRAIELKTKKKLRKRLSQSSNILDNLNVVNDIDVNDKENNTDMESVDMALCSDLEEKDLINDPIQTNKIEAENVRNVEVCQYTSDKKEDDLEDDVDLLRAKLLTSLSKNLPSIISSADSLQIPVTNDRVDVEKEKRIIINLGEESDSEAEHTKNLTKMHMKLSEEAEFQNKLDLFLKSKRLEVENNKLPNVVQPQLPVPDNTEKIEPKALKHLPIPEQIEYKKLVKRMAELEKIKKARQIILKASPKAVKDTLKPRNVVVGTNVSAINILESQIAMSRKKIAEESATMLRLKEEGTKLSQKYKIVATELRNISTAIALNKKQQKTTQIKLSKIRASHQRLLKSSSNFQHSKVNTLALPVDLQNNKTVSSARLQKENDPSNEQYKNPEMLKSVKVSIVNESNNAMNLYNPKQPVQIDINSNNQTVKVPSVNKERTVGIIGSDRSSESNEKVIENIHIALNNDKGFSHSPLENRDSEASKTLDSACDKDKDDYKSPLQALTSVTWEEDPNAVLCPFDFGGNCKDSDCKYLHPKNPSTQ